MVDGSGATAIEYGLIAALISIGAIVVLTVLGHNVTNTFSTIARNLSSGSPAEAQAGN